MEFITGQALVGKTIAAGKYEIVRMLGEGGMGTVYQARQPAMGRMVALKLIRREVVTSADAVARFHKEMIATAKVEHPNTIRVYDFGEAEGQLYLAMEFLAGRSLREVIDQVGRLELKRIVRIARQVANALGAIHERGLVHRDLKPDNVMLIESFGESDFVKVLDFGIAKSFDEEVKLTATGRPIGTPAYMSPEQAMGSAIDHRTDLYALGVMLYQMVSGRVPFDAPTLGSMLLAHATQIPIPILSLAPDTSPSLAALIMQLLHKDPAARPASAAEVAARLDASTQAFGAMATFAAAATQPSLPPKPKSRQLGAILAVAIAAAAAAGAVAYFAITSVPDSGSATVGTGTASAATAGAGTASAGAGGAGAGGAGAGAGGAGAGAGGAGAGGAGAGGAGAGGAGAGGAGAGGGNVGSPAGDSVAGRKQLDDLLEKTEPLAPEACRARDAAIVSDLLDAARALADDRRDQALRILGDRPGPSAEAWALLARAQLTVDASRAASAAAESLRLCPGYAVAHNLSGNALQKLGKAQPAEDAYVRALTAAPAYDAPRFNLGLLQLRQHDATAIGTFTELLRRRPDHPNVHLARSQAYAMQGKNAEALADLDEAVRRQPSSAEAWALLGELREHLHTGDANAAYCRAKQLGHAKAAAHCKP